MTKPVPDAKTIVKPRRGLAHILDATGYSVAGFRRLLDETATRLELGAGVLAAVAFLLRGATPLQWLILLCVFMGVLMVEALNTAIEVLTDRISPEWSLEAKYAKDLGSLAVGLSLGIAAVFVASVLFGF